MQIDFERCEPDYIRNRKEALGLWRKVYPLIQDLKSLPKLSRSVRKQLENSFKHTEFVDPRVIKGEWITTNPEYQKTIFVFTAAAHPVVDACFYPSAEIDAVAFYNWDDLHYSWFVHELQHRKRWIESPEFFFCKKIDINDDVEIEGYYNQFCSIIDRSESKDKLRYMKSDRWTSEFPYLKDDEEVTIEASEKFKQLCRKYIRSKNV